MLKGRARVYQAGEGRQALLDAIRDSPRTLPEEYDLDLALSRIGDRERAFLEARFGLSGAPPMTYQALGYRECITGARARQLVIHAIRKLRHPRMWRIDWPGNAWEIDQRRLQECPRECSINWLDLNMRTWNRLVLAFGPQPTIGQICELSEADLLAIRQMGKKSVAHLREKLQAVGLDLASAADGEAERRV